MAYVNYFVITGLHSCQVFFHILKRLTLFTEQRQVLLDKTIALLLQTFKLL